MKKAAVNLSVILAVMMFLVAFTTVGHAQTTNHVVVISEENTSYSSVVGSPSMPYINSLMAKGTLATDYYANTHPSIGNYFMLTTGQILTNDDGFNSTVTADNVVRHMLTAGKTWKSYAESLPYAGYTGGDQYPYVRHHNPLSYFSDVVNSSSEKMNLVPFFDQFASDMANGVLPDYSFIVPNMHHNMHDCPEGMTSCTSADKYKAADQWLQANVGALFSNAEFQKDGILIIWFDESSGDNTNGGGKVAFIAIGPQVKAAYQDSVFMQHQSALRMMMERIGVTTFPGAAASAPDMSEMFISSGPTPAPSGAYSVTIVQPAPGSVIYNTHYVNIQATAAGPNGVQKLHLYVDYKVVYTAWGSAMNHMQWLSVGRHRIVVQATDSAGHVWNSAAVNITVN